jgi:hypothetical protein
MSLLLKSLSLKSLLLKSMARCVHPLPLACPKPSSPKSSNIGLEARSLVWWDLQSVPGHGSAAIEVQADTI